MHSDYFENCFILAKENYINFSLSIKVVFATLQRSGRSSWTSGNTIFRDPNFTLSEFIKSLKLELKTWRKVFWRLWGVCHVATCSLCDKPFQVTTLSESTLRPLTVLPLSSSTCWSSARSTPGSPSSPTSSLRTRPCPWASIPAAASSLSGSSRSSRSADLLSHLWSSANSINCSSMKNTSPIKSLDKFFFFLAKWRLLLQ